MTQKEAVRYYGKDGPKEYSKIIQDFHRSRYVELCVFACVRGCMRACVQVDEG